MSSQYVHIHPNQVDKPIKQLNKIKCNTKTYKNIQVNAIKYNTKQNWYNELQWQTRKYKKKKYTLQSNKIKYTKIAKYNRV